MKKNKDISKAGNNTRLAHCGNEPHAYYGFVNPPIVRASTVLFPDADTMVRNAQKYTYGTHGTPTTDALSAAVNELEGSVKTFLVPSGLAAITVPLLGLLKQNDHILIVDSVYHPTRRFANSVLTKMGIEVEYYDPLIGADIAKLIKQNTKVIFTESPGSNTFEIQDIPAIVNVAKQHNIITIIDNTWATGLYFRALDYGIDISINAATKYPNGHSDVLMGFISVNERTKDIVEQIYTALGVCVSGDDAYLVLRSMRTMGIRLEHQQKTTTALAKWLEKQPQVAQVLHPALESHQGHNLWKRDFKGASSIFSIVLKSGTQKEAYAFLNNLQYFGLGYSWGGFESLAVLVDLSDRSIAKNDYAGPVIRLQIGIEDIEDLQQDLENALKATGL